MKSQKIKRKSKHTTVENYQFTEEGSKIGRKKKKQGKYEIPENSYSKGISKSLPTSNYSIYKCIGFSNEKTE